MLKLNGHVVTPTMFPDKTSQVWKLPPELLEARFFSIAWDFESEAEFLHLAQLKFLLSNVPSGVDLYISYLPYARQDKFAFAPEDLNQVTFALFPFLSLLESLDFASVTIVDPHNENALRYGFPNAYVEFPEAALKAAISEVSANVVLFPDAGAKNRYKNLSKFKGLPVVQLCATKARNQSTGEITDLVLPVIPKNSRVLIVDDICDGGATFIKLAKAIAETYPVESLSLFISHGLFTKGTQVLRDAGIHRIFTKNGEIPLES